MLRHISNVKDLVHSAENILRIAREIGKAFARQEILRIPPCRGYFLRKEDAEIRKKLKILCQRRNLSCVKTLVLHGPPGHGKQFSAANLMNQLYTSSISNSLVLRTSQTKPRFILVKPTIKWTVNATNTKTLLESYCSLAKEIGLTEEAKAAEWMLPLYSRTLEGRQYHMYLHDHCQTDAVEEALKQIYDDVMKKLRVQHSWVLLIDGPTKNVTSLDNFWPQAGDRRFGNGLVILTSESPQLQIKEGCVSSQEKVYIGKMTDSDAVKFLENKSGISATGNDKTCAKDVAVNMLKCSPQDIAKFGSFVRKYMDRTNEKRTFRDLPRTETPSECMLLLEMTHKSQAEILYFLACCSHEDFLPLQILESYFSEATEAVMQSEFVEISERDGMKMVTIHKRYHDALRDILCLQEQKPCEETWTGFYSRIVNHLGTRNKTGSPLKPPTLSPHGVSKVIKCLTRICKTALQRNSDEDFIMLRFILPHLKECVQLSKTLEVEDVKPLVTADGYACLGESLLFFGESEEARKNLEIALARYKNYRGSKNVRLDVANVLHFLGEAYSNSALGDPKIGEQYLREALKEKEQFYNGEDHPQIAFTLRSLGNVLNELGKQIEAIDQIKRALTIYEDTVKDATLKQEYGYTLSALGSSYRYLGRYSEAEDYLKKALRTFGTVESPSKLRMGVTLSRLASVQRNLDKLDESIKSLQEAEEMLRYNDIYRAVILSKLSVVYRYKGDSNNSLHFAEEASSIIGQKYGFKLHPAIATATLNLGHAQSDVWIVDEAVKNLTKALKTYEALHGENHRIVAATLNYLSYAYEQLGRVQEGKELLERAVEIMDKNYAPSHPEKANSLKRLSKVCAILGETIRSADLANSALQIYKETHGNTMVHRDVRKCAVRVAYACSKIGLFKWAEECLMEVQLGFPHDKKNHPEFAAFLQKKTEIILDKLEIKSPLDDKTIQQIMLRAADDLLTAEGILKKSPGCNDRQHSVMQKEQARVNIVLGNYEEAYQQICLALEKSQHFFQKIPNRAHYLKAEFSLVRSDAEGKLSMTNRQKESLKTAETSYRNAFGNNHPMLALTFQKLSARYFDLGCLKEADKYLEESEKICFVLRKDLQEQLNFCTSEFLAKYNSGSHPILKRQEQLARKIRRNQGAW